MDEWDFTVVIWAIRWRPMHKTCIRGTKEIKIKPFSVHLNLNVRNQCICKIFTSNILGLIIRRHTISACNCGQVLTRVCQYLCITVQRLQSNIEQYCNEVNFSDRPALCYYSSDLCWLSCVPVDVIWAAHKIISSGWTCFFKTGQCTSARSMSVTWWPMIC